MVVYELDRIENGRYYYNYYPQGNREAKGCIYTDKNDNRGIVEISKNDEFRICAGHIWRYFKYNPDKLGKKTGEIMLF